MQFKLSSLHLTTNNAALPLLIDPHCHALRSTVRKEWKTLLIDPYCHAVWLTVLYMIMTVLQPSAHWFIEIWTSALQFSRRHKNILKHEYQVLYFLKWWMLFWSNVVLAFECMYSGVGASLGGAGNSENCVGLGEVFTCSLRLCRLKTMLQVYELGLWIVRWNHDFVLEFFFFFFFSPARR